MVAHKMPQQRKQEGEGYGDVRLSSLTSDLKEDRL